MPEGSTLISTPSSEQNIRASDNSSQPHPARRRNRPPRRERPDAASQTAPPASREPRNNQDQTSRRPRNNNTRGPTDAPRASRQPRANPGNPTNEPVSSLSEQVAQLNVESSSSSSAPARPARQRARKQFGAQLTSATPAQPASTSNQRAPKPKAPPVDLDGLDLTSRLIHSFTHKDDALDCPICFNSIHPAQPIWSCSLSSENTSCCWGTFHLKCIRNWAAKSTSLFCCETRILPHLAVHCYAGVKETRDAYAARDDDREGEWRCPSCRTMRHDVPQAYKYVFRPR